MKRKVGRPSIEIDWEAFDKLCGIQCTLVEIADFFSCSEDTIENAVKKKFKVNFSEHYKRRSQGGLRSLRRSMFEKALHEKHPTMQIWLSKQYLGMADKIENRVEVKQTLSDLAEEMDKELEGSK